MYLIQTTTQEFTISDDLLDKTIDDFAADQYDILDDDSGQYLVKDDSNRFPTMVFSKIGGFNET